MTDLKDRIKEFAALIYTEIEAVRTHLHQFPELSFQEFETSKFIQSKLEEYEIPYTATYVKTGIVAKLEGKNPSKNLIALRADMDALPIQEHSENKYCSKNGGVMHACGHDMHMASLLGTAKILKQFQTEWEGSILFVFQPGEEVLPGGADLMLKEGIFPIAPRWVLGHHVQPNMPTGVVGFKAGKYMASGDEIYLNIKGKGGHAAMPHLCTDNILIASHIVLALQQVVSRHNDAKIPTVLSFGKIEANGATNIIPEEVKISGTFRTMNEEWRAKAKRIITHMAKSIAEGMGAKCEVNIKHGYPVLSNHIEYTKQAQNDAIEFLGEDKVKDLEMKMTTEDFAYYAQKYPASFYRFGVQKDKEQPLHTPEFEADDNALKTSMSLMAWLAISHLSR